MSSVILEAHDLTKEYRHTVALDHIDLKIEKGKIYGFIGQNGAGKTTFLRLVTGLAFPTSGTLSLWGKTVEKELQEQRKRIGCMIETPALFPTMTAYQNMEIQRIQRGIPDKAVIQKTLDMVGLKDTGMWMAPTLQRLGRASKDTGTTFIRPDTWQQMPSLASITSIRAVIWSKIRS